MTNNTTLSSTPLEPQDLAYLEEAREAGLNAHAPFSQYFVGSVVITESGRVYKGCNVENASYGLTMCAERNAIFQAVSTEGPQMRLRSVYLVIAEVESASPCGACRQVMGEFATPQTKIFYYEKGRPVCRIFSELLPDMFQKVN